MPSDPARQSDQELLARIRLGDEIAFGELYDRYSSPLYTYLLRLTGDPGNAEDLLQDVFLGSWRAAKRFRGEASVKTWLFRIAHHKSVSWLRKHRRKPSDLDLDEVQLGAEPDNQPEPLAIGNWEGEQVLEALAQLSEKHRAVIELSFVHHFAYPEIADILGCPVGTVKSRMSYALRYLEAELRRRQIEG